jgi:hypothetical protein
MSDPAIIAMANRMGMTVSEYLSTLPADRVAAIQNDAARRQRRTVFQSDVFDPARSVESQTGLQDGISFDQRKLDALASMGANPTRDFGGADYYNKPMPTLPTAAEIYAQDNPAPAFVPLPSVSDRDRQNLPAQAALVENAANFGNASGDFPAEGMGEFTPRGPRTLQSMDPELFAALERSKMQEGVSSDRDRQARPVSSQELAAANAAAVPSLEYKVPPLTGPRAKSRAGIELPAYKTTPLENAIGSAFSAVGEKTGDLLGALGGRTAEEQRGIDAARAEQARLDKLRGVASLTGATMVPAPAVASAVAPVAPVISSAPVVSSAPVASGLSALAAETTGGGAGGGGGGGGGGTSAASSYEQALLDTLANREKAQKQDKWLALAQVGLGMMNSQSPTLAGAIGEAGLKGVESFRQSRDQYDNDRLKILGDIEQYKMARAAAQARASGGGGGGFRQELKDQASVMGLIEDLQGQADAIRENAALSGGKDLEAEKRARAFEARANTLASMIGIDAGNAGGPATLALPSAAQP